MAMVLPFPRAICNGNEAFMSNDCCDRVYCVTVLYERSSTVRMEQSGDTHTHTQRKRVDGSRDGGTHSNSATVSMGGLQRFFLGGTPGYHGFFASFCNIPVQVVASHMKL